MKICTKCGQKKPISEFYAKRANCKESAQFADKSRPASEDCTLTTTIPRERFAVFCAAIAILPLEC